jgi:imidazolonepropionase-like amidohydrolase
VLPVFFCVRRWTFVQFRARRGRRNIAPQSAMIHASCHPRLDATCGCLRPQQRRAAAHLTRRMMLSGAASLAAFPALADLAHMPAKPAKRFLFRNFQLFDGRTPSLRRGLHLIVSGNRIAALDGGDAPAGNFQVVDCGNRVLMPGLIDAHVHTMMESISAVDGQDAPIDFVYAVAIHAAGLQLLRGFTTVRDAGGPSFGLKCAIDSGLVAGPRIFPSGAFLSQSGGHGDFDGPNDVPRTIGTHSYAERMGMTAIADGVDQVLKRVRENLRQGASQIKMMAGGGISSNHDAIDVTQYTQNELHAGVEAASAWGTYVTVNAYTPNSIRMAVAAGVRCIEHGQLADEATAALMAGKGIWWSLQPFLNDEDATPFPKDSENYRKQLQVTSGTDAAYELAKSHNIRTAFGTDILFNPQQAARQGAQLAKLKRWYTPAQVLKMATSDNAALLAMAGPRNPYPGKLGVIEKDAYADILVVSGDPLENLNLIADPQKNLALIMKDGRVHKYAM